MKTVLKICAATFLLSACAVVNQTGMPKASSGLPLTDRVQSAVVEVQEKAMASLPGEIAGFKSVEDVANREKNQRGAGFTRVYKNNDIVATVFVYNNQDFGVTDGLDADKESLMDKHLREFEAMQDSGLYSGVNVGKKKSREFRWRSVTYQVLEAEVRFLQKEDEKKSLLVLGANKDLMSYVRIRYTYPKDKQSELNKKHFVFTRTVMVAMYNFAAAQKVAAVQ